MAKLFSSDHTRLTKVNLSRCQLTMVNVSSSKDPVAVSCESIGELLCQMPPLQEHRSFHGQLRELDLDENNFSGNRIYILAGFMHLCSNLLKLSSKNCAITSDSLILLLDKLKQFQHMHSSSNVCNGLSTWNLHDNRIDDNGIIALMQCQLFPQIEGANCRYIMSCTSLTLCGNPVSGKMVKMLDQEWRKRFRVRHQSLHYAAYYAANLHITSCELKVCTCYGACALHEFLFRKLTSCKCNLQRT